MDDKFKYILELDKIVGLKGDKSKTYNRLRKLEKKMSSLNESMCNGTIDDKEAEKLDKKITKEIMSLVEKPEYIYINGDPRGYAIKIKIDIMETIGKESGIERDWGGYGIVCP